MVDSHNCDKNINKICKNFQNCDIKNIVMYDKIIQTEENK